MSTDTTTGVAADAPSEEQLPLRVVLAKIGFDGHDRGLRVVARILRDAGCEVIYLGLRQTTDNVVAVAEQEDADAIGLSMHNAGHLTLAPRMVAALRDAGMEVIYTGLRQTPDMIVRTASDEDVDVIGLSVHSGAHMTQFTRVRELMNERGLDDVLLTGGGIIPDDDAERLRAMGVARVYTPKDFELNRIMSDIVELVGAAGAEAA